jgi:hypothetical protein
MTTPAGKHPPFKLHFILGADGHRSGNVPMHLKREFGWLPNERSKQRSKRKAKRKR